MVIETSHRANTECPILFLPLEILAEVFRYLDSYTLLVTLRLVSRAFWNISIHANRGCRALGLTIPIWERVLELLVQDKERQVSRSSGDFPPPWRPQARRQGTLPSIRRPPPSLDPRQGRPKTAATLVVERRQTCHLFNNLISGSRSKTLLAAKFNEKIDANSPVRFQRSHRVHLHPYFKHTIVSQDSILSYGYSREVARIPSGNATSPPTDRIVLIYLPSIYNSDNQSEAPKESFTINKSLNRQRRWDDCREVTINDVVRAVQMLAKSRSGNDNGIKYDSSHPTSSSKPGSGRDQDAGWQTRSMESVAWNSTKVQVDHSMAEWQDDGLGSEMVFSSCEDHVRKAPWNSTKGRTRLGSHCKRYKDFRIAHVQQSGLISITITNDLGPRYG